MHEKRFDLHIQVLRTQSKWKFQCVAISRAHGCGEIEYGSKYQAVNGEAERINNIYNGYGVAYIMIEPTSIFGLGTSLSFFRLSLDQMPDKADPKRESHIKSAKKRLLSPIF